MRIDGKASALMFHFCRIHVLSWFCLIVFVLRIPVALQTYHLLCYQDAKEVRFICFWSVVLSVQFAKEENKFNSVWSCFVSRRFFVSLSFRVVSNRL